jgi:hypothetical protein
MIIGNRFVVLQVEFVQWLIDTLVVYQGINESHRLEIWPVAF